MIKIKSINWFDTERQEGELILTDGEYTMVCFSDGIDFEIGDTIDDNIFAMLSSDIIRSFDNDFYLYHHKGFKHRVIGQISDKEKGIVKVGDFLIQIDGSISKDLRKGEFIAFDVERFDIY